MKMKNIYELNMEYNTIQNEFKQICSSMRPNGIFGMRK